MTPGARLQAVIDVLDTLGASDRPADAIVSAYFRQRRFIGAKDRTAIAEGVYAILRREARLRWWLERCGHAATPRALVIAHALVAESTTVVALRAHFSGGRHAPAPLDTGEVRVLESLATHTLEHPDMPEAVRLECPDWAEAALRAALPIGFAAELRALQAPAPLDLRVNTLKTSLTEAIAALHRDGILAEPTPWSPVGLRVAERRAVAATQAFRDGWIEIQDEGSQLVALVTDARPGHHVVDFCAGAGGKTLALAASMANRGRVIACDVLGRRLERAGERLRRAGVHNVSTRPLSHERDPWVKRHKAQFDRVLVDAPCTGVGTWRRNPDARWRRFGPGLEELTGLQAQIMESVSRLVKPGGRLVYATCSLLPAENQDRIAAFLTEHKDFQLLPMATVWADAVGTTLPFLDTPNTLMVTPHRHGTDGFFAAVLERRATL